MVKQPMKATDKRRSGLSDNTTSIVLNDTDGAGPALDRVAQMFNDRRVFNGANGSGKRVF